MASQDTNPRGYFPTCKSQTQRIGPTNGSNRGFPMDDDEEEAHINENLLQDIQKAINVVHHIVYDVYNLCELYSESKLNIFKVTMLKELCEHFDIQFKSKDKKRT